MNAGILDMDVSHSYTSALNGISRDLPAWHTVLWWCRCKTKVTSVPVSIACHQGREGFLAMWGNFMGKMSVKRAALLLSRTHVVLLALKDSPGITVEVIVCMELGLYINGGFDLTNGCLRALEPSAI